MKQILRPKEASAFLSISLSTIWRLSLKGDFPPKIQLSAKAVGFESEAIFKWLEKRKATQSGVPMANDS